MNIKQSILKYNTKYNSIYTKQVIIMCERNSCSLLKDKSSYQPDTLDLNNDKNAAQYWFPCFRNMISKFAKQAASSQQDTDPTAVDRAEKFRKAYLEKLFEYEKQSKTNGNNSVLLGIRELLELHEVTLREYGFDDPWRQQKEIENARALKLLEDRLIEIDNIENMNERWTELVKGVLAGNMFDWGAQEIASILETDKNFGLHEALNRIQKRPWLIDNLDGLLERFSETNIHKCALIFVDNSGVDIVLGILPFARELLRRGTKVILSANTGPSLNDVTCTELIKLLNSACCHCSIMEEALQQNRLLIYGNGQYGPCLDFRKLPTTLCDAIETNGTDLVVIEGMGRALHTNLHAQFNCETLKLVVIKNKWLAQYLGGDTFSVICKYER